MSKRSRVQTVQHQDGAAEVSSLMKRIAQLERDQKADETRTMLRSEKRKAKYQFWKVEMRLVTIANAAATVDRKVTDLLQRASP